MNKHTPGPWTAYYMGCSDWDLNGPVTQEDWVLAAAAPELLAALIGVVRVADRATVEFDAARAAIAKATEVK
jgi:hypothetical protein